MDRNGAPPNLGRHSVLVLCEKNWEKHSFWPLTDLQRPAMKWPLSSKTFTGTVRNLSRKIEHTGLSRSELWLFLLLWPFTLTSRTKVAQGQMTARFDRKKILNPKMVIRTWPELNKWEVKLRSKVKIQVDEWIAMAQLPTLSDIRYSCYAQKTGKNMFFNPDWPLMTPVEITVKFRNNPWHRPQLFPKRLNM